MSNWKELERLKKRRTKIIATLGPASQDSGTLARLVETKPEVIAKIERAEALDSVDGILAASDAVMVARGDLGVELPPEQVPLIQDDIVYRARRRNRPAIVATQMLDSMVHNVRPARAEVSDVAHAVASGVDAVMLSAETATGDHPVEAVCMMDRIVRETEAFQWKQSAFGNCALCMSCRPPNGAWSVLPWAIFTQRGWRLCRPQSRLVPGILPALRRCLSD